MEVILKKDVANLGFENDLVQVKPGYGRNFLIPQGYAVIANKANKSARDQKMKRLEMKREAMRDQYAEILKQLDGKSIKVGAKVGESDKIFGSVTSIQLADAIKNDLGIEVERRAIKMASDIKSIGEYDFTVDLASDMVANMKVEVVAE